MALIWHEELTVRKFSASTYIKPWARVSRAWLVFSSVDRILYVHTRYCSNLRSSRLSSPRDADSERYMAKACAIISVSISMLSLTMASLNSVKSSQGINARCKWSCTMVIGQTYRTDRQIRRSASDRRTWNSYWRRLPDTFHHSDRARWYSTALRVKVKQSKIWAQGCIDARHITTQKLCTICKDLSVLVKLRLPATRMILHARVPHRPGI